MLSSPLTTKILPGVRPEYVAHGAVGRGLLEPLHLPDVLQSVEFWTEASVNTQELLVHQSCQGKTIKSLHAGFVDLLCVFDLA